MTMQKRHMARKTTALLSAIATSSLLGLPALAGNPTGVTNPGTNQTQAPSSVDQSQCVPSAQANQPSTTAAPDASAPTAAQLPNQTDPRTGISPSGQTVSPSDQASNTRINDQMARTSSTRSSESSDMNNQATSYSNQAASYKQNRLYGDVLSQGGATSGGFASQIVAAANNPDAYRSVSGRISSNEERPNFTSGNGMNGNMGSTMSTNESMRSAATTQAERPLSSTTTSSTTIARCPDGMMPQSATPSLRQAPIQPNLDAQPSSPQQTSPQQPTGNETRPSPADDNGGRTR